MPLKRHRSKRRQLGANSPREYPYLSGHPVLERGVEFNGVEP